MYAAATCTVTSMIFLSTTINQPLPEAPTIIREYNFINETLDESFLTKREFLARDSLQQVKDTKLIQGLEDRANQILVSESYNQANTDYEQTVNNFKEKQKDKQFMWTIASVFSLLGMMYSSTKRNIAMTYESSKSK